MSGFPDFATSWERPEWAALRDPPEGGWALYADLVRFHRRELVRAYRGDGVTRMAVQYLTKYLTAGPGLIEVAEMHAGFRPPWPGVAIARGVAGMRWEPPTENDARDDPDLRGFRDVRALPVWGDDHTAYDILTWAAGAPGRWARLTGFGEMLGEARLTAAWRSGKPVRLYRTPAAWLEGEAAAMTGVRRPGAMRGVCVLQNASAEGTDIWRRFEGLPQVICDDEAHADEVYAATRRAPKRALPRIRFAPPAIDDNNEEGEAAA